ncbi:WxL domain-containing protein [Enterococcus mundtii]|uniref:WxL domain-containing protein n=1 Tax=Enterococcus mundtii TaxID=53346 RepID=UPI001F4578DC|nr:WxL domain-containing protein [Enterococcus mundtii]
MKKWIIFVWLGLLLIHFALPMHSVYGIEETTDEPSTDSRTIEAGERESDDAHAENLNPETTEDISQSVDSEKSISNEEIRAEMDSSGKDSINEQSEISSPSLENQEIILFNTGPNLLQNTTFTYNTVNGGRITNWEMVGTTTPVNVLTRNVTLNEMSGTWIRTSDSRFFLGGNSLNSGVFRVSNQNNSGTMIISQTINTVVGRTYQISADFSSAMGTVSYTMTAYNGNGVVAGVGALNTSNFSLTNDTSQSDWHNRTMQFTATGTQTTIGYRIAGAPTPQGAIRYPHVAAINRSLTLQASPTVGGTPRTDANSITPGASTTISANPNEGYRFVRWENVSGGGTISSDNAESATFIMGDSDATVRAIYEQLPRTLALEASPAEGGGPSADKETLINQEETEIHANPNEGYRFVSWEVISGTGARIADTTSESTTFTMGSSDAVIQANYEEESTLVNPVDPLDPGTEVNPENPPVLPEDQGLLSIDFVSSFDFGTQVISTKDQTYYAQPQRLLNEDGTVNETEERPNYVQISDRRPESERNGWELAVTQQEQFKGKKNQILNGASISLSNQQVITAQGGKAPGLQSVPCELIPGNRRVLLKAQGNEGIGTWIYRFGDAETAKESVALKVPKGANPEATNYSTTLTWEISAVPDN